MTDEVVVSDRLSTLRTNARRLATAVKAGRDRFVAEENLYLKAERCLQLCLQAILDIGTHIIAAESLGRPAGYEDVVPALGGAGIIAPDLVERLAGIAGLRNILVHDYLTVDHGTLFDDLSGGLPDFEAFAKAIEVYMASTSRG